jgi:hypothetical protein
MSKSLEEPRVSSRRHGAFELNVGRWLSHFPQFADGLYSDKLKFGTEGRGHLRERTVENRAPCLVLRTEIAADLSFANR